MTQHLFVYGTLRRQSLRPIARRLHREAQSLGDGLTRGALYDLGGYPGALFGAAKDGVVLGEVFVLPDDGLLLAALDEYEGLAQHDPEGDYHREAVAVSLSGGGELIAFAYGLVWEPPQHQRIGSGDWLRHLHAQSAAKR
jgi:gamma-glutamylcyclotransferase (GGCT)/AIG2-like uncharacterized protein YtfP